MKSILLCTLLIASTLALYDEDSKVVKLTKDNFKELVLDSSEPWLVEFYAPWCGHCKALAPEYNKAAKALHGIVNIGAVDMDADKEVGTPYSVSSFPTIKFFGLNKSSPSAYEGERKKNAIVDWLLDRAREIALNRLGVEIKPQPSEDDSKVVVLTDSNFNEMVMESADAWLVEFYAPWCGHCKALAPEWNKLSHQADIPIAKVDATAQTELKSRFKIEGFPTIIYFPPTNKRDSHKKYEGGRDVGSMLDFINKQKGEDAKVVKEQLTADLVHVTSEEKLQELCKVTCVLGFLSSDSNDEQEILKKTGYGLTGRASVGYFIGGENEEFEAELNVLGEGYPQVVVLDFTGKKYFKFKSQLNVDNLNDFVKGVLKKTETGTQLPTLPKIQVKTDL